MRVHISIYGTEQEVKNLNECLFIYSDDTVKDKTHHVSRVLRSGEWQSLHHWYLSTRHFTTRLIESIRAFCFLHPHTAYLITNVDDIKMEANWTTQTELYNMHYHAQELSIESVIQRLTFAHNAIDAILSNKRNADSVFAYVQEIIGAILFTNKEQAYTLETLLDFADKTEIDIMGFYQIAHNDRQYKTELMTVKAIQQMCRESLGK